MSILLWIALVCKNTNAYTPPPTIKNASTTMRVKDIYDPICPDADENAEKKFISLFDASNFLEFAMIKSLLSAFSY